METFLNILIYGVFPVLGFFAIFFVVHSLASIANSLKKMSEQQNEKK